MVQAIFKSPSCTISINCTLSGHSIPYVGSAFIPDITDERNVNMRCDESETVSQEKLSSIIVWISQKGEPKGTSGEMLRVVGEAETQS